jgi:protein SCO1/2
MNPRAAAAIALCLTVLAGSAHALTTTEASGVDARPAIGTALPATLRFHDEQGRSVMLGAYWVNRPTVLVLGYYGCSNLCGLVLHGLAAGLVQAGLHAGRDVDVLAVSIDPLEGPSLALARKHAVLVDTGSTADEAGWHFLTGDSAAIDALTDAAGYSYRYDHASGTYAHPAGILVVAPGGTVRARMGGVGFDPAYLRASVGGTAEATGFARWLLCFHDDPSTGRYSAAAMTATRVVAAATFVFLLLVVARAVVRARGTRRRVSP